ncbi:MAG: HEAT repeat domain-containing protein [Spirochaetales bacterium]|nr:HEAT repeat domain-containing protein [Spirochaetales bacterium]
MLNLPGDISPLWLLLTLPVIVWLLYRLISRLVFLNRIGKIHRGELYAGSLKKRELIRYYKDVEKKLSDPESPLYKRQEIGDLWVDRLIQTGGIKWYHLISKHFAGEYLYPCFMHSLKGRKLFQVFQENLGDNDIQTLETLGSSCSSLPFDGKTASQMLWEQKKLLRELTLSSKGDVRYFAYNILVHYEDDLSLKTVSGGFNDPHMPVRRLLVDEAVFEDREQGYAILEHILLNDPSRNVRLAAAGRVNKDYGDLKKIDPSLMSTEQALHYLSLMEAGSDQDENLALDFLLSEESSLVREAAIYLEKKGVLRRYAQELHLGDKTDFERKYKLLSKAVSVNVTGFFQYFPWDREGPIMAAARLLVGRGDLKWLQKLAETVFSRDPYGTENSLEIYRTAVKTIDGSGSDECHRLKALELKKHQNDPLLMEVLLESIPPEREYYYLDDLFFLLENGQDFCRQLVRERLFTYEPSLILTELTEQLLNEENVLSFRADILIVLAALHLDYTLQMILEHLPLLDEEELLNLSSDLDQFDQEKLRRLAVVLFDSCDSDIHRTLTFALPLSQGILFRERFFKFLSNRDWDLRRAALIKLHSLDELKVDNGLPLLNDPDERVRATAVSLLMDLDEEGVQEVIGELLFSKDESENVKKAVISGLINSDSNGSLDLLFDYLSRNEGKRGKIIPLLAGRRDKVYVEGLIRNFVKSDPAFRKELKPIFIALGMAMDEPMAELLRKQSSEARKLIEEILEEGGYTDKLISALRNPDQNERIRAVEQLISLENRETLKAVFLAADDPSGAVRVGMVRALEKLNTEGSSKLLKELCEDPDKKVRTFAFWALERLENRNSKA